MYNLFYHCLTYSHWDVFFSFFSLYYYAVYQFHMTVLVGQSQTVLSNVLSCVAVDNDSPTTLPPPTPSLFLPTASPSPSHNPHVPLSSCVSYF